LTEAAHKKQPRGDKKAGNLFLKHVPSDETDLYISHVNDNQHLYTWTANTCMLQTHHKDYDKQKLKVEKSFFKFLMLFSEMEMKLQSRSILRSKVIKSRKGKRHQRQLETKRV